MNFGLSKLCIFMSERKNIHTFAKIFSHLTGPPTEIPVIIFLLLNRAGVGRSSFLSYAAVFLFFGWGIPVAYFAYALRRGWIRDINATDRRDRPVPYAVAVAGWTILIFFVLNVPTFVDYPLFQYFYALLLVIWLITFFYKVSVHAALNTALYLLLNQVCDWRFWWLFPLVLLVCWSRWINKKHSFWQLVLGVAVAVGLWGAFCLVKLP